MPKNVTRRHSWVNGGCSCGGVSSTTGTLFRRTVPTLTPTVSTGGSWNRRTRDLTGRRPPSPNLAVGDPVTLPTLPVTPKFTCVPFKRRMLNHSSRSEGVRRCAPVSKVRYTVVCSQCVGSYGGVRRCTQMSGAHEGPLRYGGSFVGGFRHR